MFALAVVTLLITISSTRLVEGKCCMPNQWEGIETTIFGHGESVTSSIMQLSYDATRKMVVMNLTNFVNEKPQPKVQVLIDYKQQTLYTWAGKSCNKSSYASEFPPPCLPDTAREVGKSFLGAGKDILDFVAYLVSGSDNDGTVTVVYLTKTCIPISQIAYNANSGDKFVMSVGFDNITVGIKDQSVFKLPAICKQQFYTKDMLHHVRRIRRKNVFGF